MSKGYEPYLSYNRLFFTSSYHDNYHTAIYWGITDHAPATIYPILSWNSEAFASLLQWNFDGVYPMYYMYSDIFI